MSKTPIAFVAAGALEYRSYEIASRMEYVAIASAVGTIVSTVLAFRSFWRANLSEIVMLLLDGLLAELTAATLVISGLVKAIMRR